MPLCTQASSPLTTSIKVRSQLLQEVFAKESPQGRVPSLSSMVGGSVCCLLSGLIPGWLSDLG